jgi:hypothetical protein
MNTTVTASPYAPYAIQVTLHYGKTITQRAGNIVLYKKASAYGKSEYALDMCLTYGCKGVFQDPFLFTEAERDAIDALEYQEIGYWPEAIRTRYTNWSDSIAVCPLCHQGSPRSELADCYVFNNTLENVADVVETFFRTLDSNADLVLKIHKDPGSLQKARQNMQDTKNMGRYAEELEKARDNFHVYYPMKKLLRDMSAGATLRACILGFLKS